MDLFSQTELIVMLSILGGIVLVILILTILDLIDERKDKKETLNELVRDEVKVVKEDLEYSEPIIEKKVVEEIEVLDFDEPIIEMKEEINNNEVTGIIDELEEINFAKEADITLVKEDSLSIREKAQEELQRLEDGLQKEEDYANAITNFELEQEENAIISYDELKQNINRLYDQNEVVQYDDGNEPITIDEVIRKFSNNEMVFENTANLDKLNRELHDKSANYVEKCENE